MTQESTLMSSVQPARLEKVTHGSRYSLLKLLADINPGTTRQILAEMSQDTIAEHVYIQ